MSKSSGSGIPGLHKHARNPRFIRGTPPIAHEKKLPVAKTVNPMKLANDAAHQSSLSAELSPLGLPSPSRTAYSLGHTPQITIGNIGK